MSVRMPMYSGSMAESASPVARACTSDRSRPASPRMAVTESCRPASEARRHPSICSATVMPLWMSASVCSSPDSRPEVEELDAALAQRRQLLDRLAQQVARVGVAAHALQVGQGAMQEVEDRVELARAQGHRVAVGEEHAPHPLAHAHGQAGDVLHDLVERPHRERLLQVGAAEVAGVVGAAVGDLDDQAVGFAGRADDGAVVPHAADASTGARAARPGASRGRPRGDRSSFLCVCE